MTSRLRSRRLLVAMGGCGVAAIWLSFLHDLLYDKGTDFPNRQEISDARNPHPSRETVSAGVDHPP
jgi:hypothetical protein